MLTNAQESVLPAETEVIQTSKMEIVRPINGIKTSVNSCTPDFRAGTVAEIDFNRFAKLGVETAVLDVDNTLTRTGQSEIPQEILDILTSQKEKGILKKIIIATDSRRDLSGLTTALDAERIPTPLLRRKKTYQYWKNLVTRLAADGCQPHQAVMIGDSPTWDMRGANRAGLVTTLVEPFSDPALIEKLAFKTRGDERARKGMEPYGREQNPPVVPYIPHPRQEV